jgi:NAD kinase
LLSDKRAFQDWKSVCDCSENSNVRCRSTVLTLAKYKKIGKIEKDFYVINEVFLLKNKTGLVVASSYKCVF